MRHLLTGLICFLFVGGVSAQSGSTDFSLEAYQQFLSQYEQVDYETLENLTPPGNYQEQVTADFSAASYSDSLMKYYGLNDEEIGKLEEQSFVVSNRIRYKSFAKALRTIYKRDLPLYISSDLLLRGLHRSYDILLKQIEMDAVIPALKTMLREMHGEMASLEDSYAELSQFEQPLRDVDYYLTVPMRLLDMEVEPYYDTNVHRVDTTLQLIQGREMNYYPIFSEVDRKIDFSQFKPRGHYTDRQQLKEYFKAMMWLGRIELYLKTPDSRVYNMLSDSARFQIGWRQTITSYMMREARSRSEQVETYQAVDETIRFLVGESDNIRFSDLNRLQRAVDFENLESLADSSVYGAVRQEIENQPDMGQRILSQVLMADPTTPESIEPARAFMFSGQRFIIDSYIMGKLVHDHVNGRLLPKSADVLYTLGNNQALPLLEEEIDTYGNPYSRQLAALRHLVDQYGNDYWNSSFFTMWLQAIRALNPPSEDRQINRQPEFMQSEGWTRKTMTTQLASWAELRHDNLLYAKQSYTGGIVCEYPKVLVEPVPGFYDAIKTLSGNAKKRFRELSLLSDHRKDRITEYFGEMQGIADTLGTVAEKTLSGEAVKVEEEHFLKSIAYEQESHLCGVQVELTGWFKKLFYGHSDNALLDQDLVVADVHTAPTDRAGNMVGYVMHAGTGPLNLAVVQTEMPNDTTYTFAGPVMSYYEHVTTNFERLTDEEWENSVLEHEETTRPTWNDGYLSRSGDPYYDKVGVGVSVPDEEPGSAGPRKVTLHGNYPNPFNPSTIINFYIPSSKERSAVHLEIYNTQGQKVATLIDGQSLSAGSYSSQWNAENAASGVYFYRLRVGEVRRSGKMTLVK